MRKITALMIMLCMAAVLSAGSWFTTYGAAYNVDLSDDRTFCGISTSEPAYGSTPGYSDATHIAIAGVQDTSSESTIHITFNSNTTQWMYQSAKQPNLRRPFGIDIVVKERWERQGSAINGAKEVDTTRQIIHLGYQPSGDASYQDSFTLRRTDGNIWDWGRNLSDEANWGYKYDMIGSWVDIVLVLPPVDRNSSQYTVGSADDYYASFDLDISGGAAGVFHCEFTGWYENPADEEVQFMLNVVPLAASSSINLDAPDAYLYGTDGIAIGNYSYSTTRDRSLDDGHEYYAFVSSSSDTLASKGEFTLVLENQSKAPSLNEDAIRFEVGIESQYGRPTKWFNGDVDMYDVFDTAGAENTFYSSEERVMDQMGDDGTLYQHYDDGSIRFRLAEGADPSTLTAGIYRSEVYFHVVSWR